ncbi:MAG: metallophosphoesterase [Syntrophales bacterium]|nr:metallophosphoesterase [Syntrophales bacterium]
MKIIYLADIHGAFERVKDLLAATDAQVYIIAGDLIDRPFYTREMSARYRALQSGLSRLQCRLGDEEADLDDFAEDLLKRTDLPGGVLEQAAEYRDATVRARRVLQQKYKILESILFLKGTSQIFCLPGNYDMDLQYTSLHGRDLHRHWHYAADLRIAGYGGADVATPGIPQRYSVRYLADSGMSEMTRFFTETRPDIIVTHKPAHGIHDHVPPMGEIGSPELRRFCEENRIPLCLTGHIHDQWGFAEIEGTIYLNPSNFGEVLQPGGRVSEGGFFYSIETSGRQIAGITLSKIVRGRVREVAFYRPENGIWVKDVLDPERFGALLRGKNCDLSEATGEQAFRDELKQKMRWFFPGGMTDHAVRAASEQIQSAASSVEKRYGVTVSADLLADRESPSRDAAVLDVILYVRGGLKPEIVDFAVSACPLVRIADWIDLDQVSRSLSEKNYECDVTLRFAAYRAAGSALRDGGAAELEDSMGADPAFRGEIEGTGFAYMEIFQNLAARVENMKVFDARLRELGITAPEAFKRRVRECLHGGHKSENQETD